MYKAGWALAMASLFPRIQRQLHSITNSSQPAWSVLWAQLPEDSYGASGPNSLKSSSVLVPIPSRVRIYSEDLSADEKAKIVRSLQKALGVAGLKPERVWGEVIEDRGSQITFSALGQEAPLEEKDKWDSDFTKRKKIKAILDTFIPEFSVRMGGATSIDVTKPGIDKAYGIGKLQDLLRISLKEMIFIGDALFVGGNDFAVKEAGVVSISVRGPNETKPVTAAILACLDQAQLA
jgi:phosphomannomutase